jgi:murein DD-endopeptidase MepM/ murein hydrolase activator NlpD
MHSRHHKILVAAFFILLIAGAIAASVLSARRASSPSSQQKTTQVPKPKPTPPVIQAPAPQLDFVEPVAQFRQRITKKLFGTYVTPSSSPVQPERFTGYHAGDDAEYQDVTGIVPVHSIKEGQVVSASWVSGYGGLIIIRHQINGAPHLVLYGHLDPNSLLPIGTTVARGQQIGQLGVGYSTQTDGERRHLHFAILAGNTIDYRGYATTQAGLSAWIDPLTFSYGTI